MTFNISSLPAGVTATWGSNPATADDDPLTLSVPAGTDLLSGGGYYPFTVTLTGGTCSYTALQGAVVAQPLISGPNKIWWFNGVNSPKSGGTTAVSLYPTTVTLTASPANAGSYIWQLYTSALPVAFSNGSTTMTTEENTVQVVTTGPAPAGASSFFVGVGVNYGTLYGINVIYGSAYFYMNMYEPWTFKTINDQSTGCQPYPVSNYVGYDCFVGYAVLNQMGGLFPANPIAINEHWTSSAIIDYSGANWIQPPECGALHQCLDSFKPNSWYDHLAYTDLPPPNNQYIPVPQSPQAPPGPAVEHWSGVWSVGSQTPGVGMSVQTNTWQFYLDHAAHTNIKQINLPS